MDRELSRYMNNCAAVPKVVCSSIEDWYVLSSTVLIKTLINLIKINALKALFDKTPA